MTRKNRKATRIVLPQQPTRGQQIIVLPQQVTAGPRGRPRRQRARRRQRLGARGAGHMSRMGRMSGGHGDIASFLACGSQNPMKFPDGSFYPSLPYQCRTRINLGVTGSGTVGVVIQADDWINFYTQPPGGVNGGGNYSWTPTGPVGSPYSTNAEMAVLAGEIASYRTTAIRICGKYIGPTGIDGGTIYVKSGLLDWANWGEAYANIVGPSPTTGTNFSAVYPNSVNDATQIDFTTPLREGFELILQPADPTTRKYRSADYIQVGDNATEPDATIEAINQLQAEQGDRWPWVNVTVVGADGTSSSAKIEIEVVADFELQMRPNFLGSRANQPSPPDDPAVRAALGNAYRRIVDVGANIASRAATTALGGIQNYIVAALQGGVGALGGRMGGMAMLGMSRLMSRPFSDVRLPYRRHPMIEEL